MPGKNLDFLLMMLLVAALAALPLSAQLQATPLYAHIRPVTSLPWTEPKANTDAVLKRIYQDPSNSVRYALLEAYLPLLEPSQFPHAFDLCTRLEEDDTPDDLLPLLIYCWAQVDPAAAWQRCEELYPTIMEQDALAIDSWRTQIYSFDFPAIQNAHFWPGSDSFAQYFVSGMSKSGVPEDKKQRLAERAQLVKGDWQVSREKLRDKMHTPEAMLSRKPKEGEWSTSAFQTTLIQLLAATPAEIEEYVMSRPFQEIDKVLFGRAMARWIDGDPAKCQSFVQRWWDHLEPEILPADFDRDAALNSLPLEFWLEWARLDRVGLLELHGERDFRGLLNLDIAILITAPPDEGGIGANEVAAMWHPESAFTQAWANGGPDGLGDLVTSLAAGHAISPDEPPPNFLRMYAQVLAEYKVPPSGEGATMLLECLSGVDAEATARYGMWWMLTTRVPGRNRLIRTFTGYEDPGDASVEDRTYGALRIWSARRPEAVRAWIASEPTFDGEMKSALNWLVDHAVEGTGKNVRK